MSFSSQQRGPTPGSTKDYYKVLQISRDASTVDVRKAFFNLAKKYHPDLNTHKREEDRQQAKILFQEINEAHQILADEKLRAKYDSVLTG